MWKKIILTMIAAVVMTGLLNAQSNDALEQKIEALEDKVVKTKNNLNADEQKKYYAALSDIENRKNMLRSMLRTPAEKRDDKWKRDWDMHYNKAMEKISAIGK